MKALYSEHFLNEKDSAESVRAASLAALHRRRANRQSTHRIVVLPVVLAECVFVLESFYRHPRPDIASALGRLISSPGVEISEVGVHLNALHRYRGTTAHFVDCLIAATAVAKNVPVSTFDQDFRKFVDVRVQTE
jgi:predicted nucleic-acid-binding protein